MHVALDLRHMKVPPVKRAASEVKMQVGVVLSIHWDSPVNAGHRGLPELVRFDRTGDMLTDGARHHHGLGRAEAIGDIDLLREEVGAKAVRAHLRSEEHTSELQSLRHLVCRLLLEK